MALYITLAFIVSKGERPVFHNGSTDGCAKDVVDVLGGDVGCAAVALCLLCKEVICLPEIRSVVFVDSAVDIVGATSGDKCGLRARRASLLRSRVACGHAKLGNSILRDAQDGIERGSAVDVIHIHSIQGHVALVGAATIHRAAARVICEVCRAWPQIDDAGLKSQQRSGVSGNSGQVFHLLCVKCVAQGRVCGVQQWFHISGHCHFRGGRR